MAYIQGSPPIKYNKTNTQSTSQVLLPKSLPLNPEMKGGTHMYKARFDPNYVQVAKHEAAEILGITTEELDHRRARDKHCPKGFRDWERFPPTTRFRLSDIYEYSENIMNRAQEAPTDPIVD